MPEIEVDRIARQQSPHEKGQLGTLRTKEQMSVIRKKCPSETVGFGFLEKGREPLQEEFPIRIIQKNIALLDAAYDDVLQKTRNVKSSDPRHGAILS
jgi:hypothetical protein